MAISTDRYFTGLTGTNAETFFKIEDEDLSISDMICPRALNDRVNRRFDELLIYCDLEFDFF